MPRQRRRRRDTTAATTTTTRTATTGTSVCMNYFYYFHYCSVTVRNNSKHNKNKLTLKASRQVLGCTMEDLSSLVAEWIHCTLFGIILPTIKLKVYTFWGLGTEQLSFNPKPPILKLPNHDSGLRILNSPLDLQYPSFRLWALIYSLVGIGKFNLSFLWLIG